MEYKGLQPISKQADRTALTETEAEASEALFRAAETIDDQQWLEDLLVKSLSDGRFNVRRAVLGLGYVARIHRRINLEIVVPQLI